MTSYVINKIIPKYFLHLLDEEIARDINSFPRKLCSMHFLILSVQGIALKAYCTPSHLMRRDISPNHLTRRTCRVFMNNQRFTSRTSLLSWEKRGMPHAVRPRLSLCTVSHGNNLYTHSLFYNWLNEWLEKRKIRIIYVGAPRFCHF